MEIHELSAVEIHKHFLDGIYSAEQIVNHFLNRIEKYNPSLGAFLEVYNERALEKARLLDQKKLQGQKLGKLAGVPIAIKDNIHVKDQITTCASKFLVNYKAPFNATVTERLEEEDAIIIGKTNLDEFAMGSSTENSALGTTCNPWDLERVAGGSSGGSAVAVAARLCPLALGSDTGGSIRQPASLCGIFGFKPTYGRVSRYGLVAFGSSLDQIGPFATTSEDIGLIMEVMGQHCEKDSTSIPEGPENYLEKMNQPFDSMKIGVPWQFLKDLADEPKQIFEKALDVYKKLGASIVEVDLSLLKYSIAVYYILATAEASTNLARFDGVRYGVRSKNAHTLRDVYDLSKEEGFGKEVKRRIMLGTYVLSSGYQDAYYKKAQKVRNLIIQQYNKAFQECDLIALPVTPFIAFKKGEIKDPVQMYLEDIYTISANLAGIPAISIPDGFSSNNLPLGLQLMAPQKQDVKLIHAAKAFQNETDHYKKIPNLINKE